MTKAKTNTTSNQQYSQQNNYGWNSAPINAQTQAIIDAANAPIQTVDPSTFHRFAQMKEENIRSYNDPFGAGTSTDVREKAQRAASMKIDTARDKAMREDYFAGQDRKFGRQVTAASFTQPQMVVTSSSGTQSGVQNTTQQAPMINTIAQVAGAVVGAA